MELQLPEDFKIRLSKQFGDSTTDFLKALENNSPISIRINPNKIKPLHTTLDHVPWCPSGYFLEKRPSFTIDPWFQSGAYYVQESSSMFIHHILSHIYKNSYPEYILDLCGAPGGKTTLMAAFFPKDVLIVANEVVKSRANILTENIDKWGADNVVVTNNDPKHFSRLKGFFDFCLIDAPCSGEGLFRKDPASIKQWNLSAAKLCAQRQKRILMDVWDSIQENGIIIYSTCTYNPEENEENLHWLAFQHKIEFIEIQTLPDWNIDPVEYKGVKGYRFLPHRISGEGFFVSVFRKLSPQKTTKYTSKNKQNITSIPKNFQEEVLKYSKTGNPFVFNNLIINTPVKNKWINRLGNELNVVRGGCKIATIAKNNLKPEHAASLSWNLNTNSWEKIHLDTEQVNKFYRKENFIIPAKNKGWYIAFWNNLPIGFVNQLGNRVNTSLPTEYRIIKSFPSANINVLGNEFEAII